MSYEEAVAPLTKAAIPQANIASTIQPPTDLRT